MQIGNSRTQKGKLANNCEDETSRVSSNTKGSDTRLDKQTRLGSIPTAAEAT